MKLLSITCKHEPATEPATEPVILRYDYVKHTALLSMNLAQVAEQTAEMVECMAYEVDHMAYVA